MGVAPCRPTSRCRLGALQEVATSQAAGVDAQPAYEACEQYQGANANTRPYEHNARHRQR
jgi:hypothetical protein